MVRSSLVVIACAALFLPQPGLPQTSTDAVAPDEPSATVQVIPRERNPQLFPCSKCHQFLPANPEPRPLAAHSITLNHGGGQFWCLECHDAEQHDRLAAHGSDTYSFDEAAEVCGVCHSKRYQDWRGGAHGKAAGSWQGVREIYSCVECHNPHDPAIKPRPPSPPPQVRRGLEPTASRQAGDTPSWLTQEPGEQ